jgi:hypothetical protein
MWLIFGAKRKFFAGQLFVIDRSIIRILAFAINYALVSPVTEIIHRCTPAHIILLTKGFSFQIIMASINIQSISKDMGLSVRNCLPKRKIWIKT